MWSSATQGANYTVSVQALAVPPLSRVWTLCGLVTATRPGSSCPLLSPEFAQIHVRWVGGSHPTIGFFLSFVIKKSRSSDFVLVKIVLAILGHSYF